MKFLQILHQLALWHQVARLTFEVQNQIKGQAEATSLTEPEISFSQASGLWWFLVTSKSCPGPSLKTWKFHYSSLFWQLAQNRQLDGTCTQWAETLGLSRNVDDLGLKQGSLQLQRLHRFSLWDGSVSTAQGGGVRPAGQFGATSLKSWPAAGVSQPVAMSTWWMGWIRVRIKQKLKDRITPCQLLPESAQNRCENGWERQERFRIWWKTNYVKSCVWKSCEGVVCPRLPRKSTMTITNCRTCHTKGTSMQAHAMPAAQKHHQCHQNATPAA